MSDARPGAGALVIVGTAVLLTGCGGKTDIVDKVKTPQVESLVGKYVGNRAASNGHYLNHESTHCARTEGLTWECFTDYDDAGVKGQVQLDVTCDRDTGKCIYTVKGYA